MKKLISFHGKVELKANLLLEIKKHQELDEIAQGRYKSEKGGKLQLCAVGCAIHSLNELNGKSLECSDHGVYETELGIPRIIARLEDGIFEGLKIEEAKTFPYEFIEAVPVGVDLSTVWPKFLHWLLVDTEHGVIKFAKTDNQRKVIQDVADLYQRKINGEDIDVDTWITARRAAYAAAAAAAYAAYAAAAAAAYAAAAAAAYAAAAAAAYAAAADAADADAAAAAAYAAAAAAAARYLVRSVQKSKLLQLLKECI